MKTKLVLLAMLFVSSFGFAKEKNPNVKSVEKQKVKNEIILYNLKKVNELGVGLACCQTKVMNPNTGQNIFLNNCQEYNTEIKGAENVAMNKACKNVEKSKDMVLDIMAP